MKVQARAEIGLGALTGLLPEPSMVLSEKRIEAANPRACQIFRITSIPALSAPDQLLARHLEAGARAQLADLVYEALRGRTGRLSLAPELVAPGTLRRLCDGWSGSASAAGTIEVDAVPLSSPAGDGLALLEWRFKPALEAKPEAGKLRASVRPGLEIGAISQPFATLLGCNREQAEGRSILEAFHPDDHHRLAQLIEETAWSEGKVVGGAAPELSACCRVRTLDGAWRWHRVLVSAVCQTSELGLELEPIERRIGDGSAFDRLFSVATDLLCILDERGCFLRVNEAWQQLLGFGPGELVSRSLFDFVHRDDVLATLDELQQCEAAPAGKPPEPADFVNRFRHVDGSWHWLAWRTTPLPDLGFILCSARDVTERRYTAEALRCTEEKFRAATEGGLDAFFILEARRSAVGTIDDLVVVDVNPLGAEMVGAGRSEVLGRSLADLLGSHASAASRYAPFFEVVETRATLSDELQVSSPDGRTRWLRVQAAPLADGITLTCRDVTAQHQLEQELRQSQKMEALGRLAGGVAHDFNNLLTVINGYTDLLLEEPVITDSGLLEEAREIREAGERASALTRQLLAFGRQQVTKPRELDLAKVVAQLEKMLRRLIGEHIDFRVRLPDGDAHVLADEGQIEQVVMNLVVNARDALEGSGTIEVSVSVCRPGSCREDLGEWCGEQGCVELRVRDDGIGMDEHTRSRIFEPFFTTKPQGKGTGLGLSTVHGIAQQNGGRLLVDSSPGQGSAFSLVLKRITASAAPGDEHHPGIPRSCGSGRVLLVEDEAQIRALALRVLEEAGYEVLVAHDGGHALEVLEREARPVDLVMTDVVMPELSGPELVKRLRAQCPDTRVLYVSGYAENELPERPADARTAFLSKPFRPSEVVEQVEILLRTPDPDDVPA